MKLDRRVKQVREVLEVADQIQGNVYQASRLLERCAKDIGYLQRTLLWKGKAKTK